METYRLSSKVSDEGNEYLIQTANDTNRGAVLTNIYVNGRLSETFSCPHPYEVKPEEVVSLVKLTHDEKKQELESLLQAYRRVQQDANGEAMNQLGVAFYYKGLYAEARSLFQGALALDSDNHQAANHLGMAELALGNIPQAIHAATVAVSKRPGFADYHHNLGEAYLAGSDSEQAAAEFEKAISINMYYSDAYLSLGMARILHAILKPDPADWPRKLSVIKDCMIKATLIYADYRCPEFESGISALEGGDLSRSLEIFKLVAQKKRERNRQESASFYLRAALFPELVSGKMIADRIEYLEAEIKKNPSYVDLQAELSRCYLEQAKIFWQKGVDQYRRTYQLSPSLAKVRLALEESEQAYEDIALTLRKISE